VPFVEQHCGEREPRQADVDDWLREVASEDRRPQGTYRVFATLLLAAPGAAMSTISERLSKLSSKGNLTEVDQELVQIIQQLDQRLRKLEGGVSSSDPIESELGMTAPQSR
jgi:poly-D-alanine transfer protein DltD